MVGVGFGFASHLRQSILNLEIFFFFFPSERTKGSGTFSNFSNSTMSFHQGHSTSQLVFRVGISIVTFFNQVVNQLFFSFDVPHLVQLLVESVHLIGVSFIIPRVLKFINLLFIALSLREDVIKGISHDVIDFIRSPLAKLKEVFSKKF